MRIGIYFAYWEHDWAGNYHEYIDRVADLGFDTLELSCASLPESDSELRSLGRRNNPHHRIWPDKRR